MRVTKLVSIIQFFGILNLTSHHARKTTTKLFALTICMKNHEFLTGAFMISMSLPTIMVPSGVEPKVVVLDPSIVSWLEDAIIPVVCSPFVMDIEESEMPKVYEC